MAFQVVDIKWKLVKNIHFCKEIYTNIDFLIQLTRQSKGMKMKDSSKCHRKNQKSLLLPSNLAKKNF